MATYPEKPLRISGYTDEWIASFLDEKASASQISKYLKAIDGKGKKDKKQIFYDMFIAEKKRQGKPSLEDKLKAIAKQKRIEAKKAKEEAKDE